MWTDPVDLSRPRSPFAAARTKLSDRETIDGDQRQRVTNTLAVPYRWVCSIDVVRGTVLNRGSGLLIGARHVLTAAHNVYDQRGTRPDTVHVAPARNGRTDPLGRYLVSGWNTTSAFLSTSRAGTRFDFALLTLDKEVGLFTFRVLGDKQLGWWGSSTNGQGTSLQPLRPAFLESKDVVVCGYPGDKCGALPYDPATGCPARDQATTLWSNFGPAHFAPGLDGILLHAADTHKGQSGSPVWIKSRDSSRRLVGVHVAPNRVWDASTGRFQVVRHNRSVHLSADVAALIQGWIR
jgi:V8-like Glu-specific endopeptidase